MSSLRYNGSRNFRQRIVVSILSGKSLRIDNIRHMDENPGLQAFEANFLSLIEKLSDGCTIKINTTGTCLKFKPGILTGGSSIHHDCGTTRSVGWFIEAVLPLLIFSREPSSMRLSGVTNDTRDMSVDVLKNVTIPLLKRFGVYGAELKVLKRGSAPNGGGLVELTCPVARELRTVNLTDHGRVKRVRGIAFCARVSPAVAMRMAEAARGVLNGFLPDVYIHTDCYRKADGGGHSAGYSLSLVAESALGGNGNDVVLISAERTALPAELPEDVGREGAIMLLEEIRKGGCIDSGHQPLVLLMMALSTEDVNKVRFGGLTEQSFETLRLLRDALGVVFKVREDRQRSNVEDSSCTDDSYGEVLLSCLGTGHKNISRKIK